MANYSIKLDLQKLQGAFVTKIQGKTSTKTCICIPVEDAGLFVGKQGCYLDLTAVEIREPKYEDTHCIKQQYSKEKYQAMTEDEKRAIPIIGGLKQQKMQQVGLQNVKTTTQVVAEGADELPF